MQIAIGLYPGFTALDVIGPYNVFSNWPGAEVVFCAAERGVVPDDTGLLRVDVEHTFADIPAPEVLLVGGGLVTRKVARDGHPIIDWVKAAHETTTYTTSVCTGALLLGAAGILEGKVATTHWMAYETLASYGATPTEQRVVVEGKVWTAAGVSAGIDLALALVDQVDGPMVAQAIQLGIEYDPQPPHDSGAPSKATPEVRDLVAAVMTAAEEQLLSS
jgi:transcriptional regulator GlxA family with amidase domain